MENKYTQRISKNEIGRDFVIGDIHANKKRLFKALNSVCFDKTKDRLFSVGDLIDRGKHNIPILDLLCEDWFFAVRGNHEQMLINRFEFPLTKLPYQVGVSQTSFGAEEVHERNGGKWFARLRSELAKTRIYQNLSALPYAIELETNQGVLGIVHAEVPERFDAWSEFVESLRDSKTREDAVWNRLAIESVYHTEQGKYWEAEFTDASRFIEGIDAVVHGHTGVHESVICGNQIWIDTGQKTGELTILQVEDLLDLVEKNND